MQGFTKKFIGLGLASCLATAAYAGPISLPADSPLYIKFDGRQQFSLDSSNPTWTGTNETNWGVITVSSISLGSVSSQNVIETTSGSIFNDVNSHNAQITGIFYDIQGLPALTAGNQFPATGGYLDLYWRDLNLYSTTNLSNAAPGVRTAQDKATGFTDGDFLVRLSFAPGIIDASIPNADQVSIAGSSAPTGSGFFGSGTAYANVNTLAGGAWAERLDSDWFTTSFGTRDLRFRNIYEEQDSWTQNGFIGGRLTDPATAYTVPEPVSIALIGLGLLGMGTGMRRRKSAA